MDIKLKYLLKLLKQKESKYTNYSEITNLCKLLEDINNCIIKHMKKR